MHRRSRVILVIATLVVALCGYALLDSYDVVPGVLTRSRPPVSAAVQAGGASPALPDRPQQAPLSQPRAPLDPTDGLAPVPEPAALAAHLRGALRNPHLGTSVGATVRDAATGRHLLDLRADKALTPASTTKLLTAAAVASTLDMESRFATRVVRGATARDIILVAGGDSLLDPGAGDPRSVAGRAGLGDLAAQVASSLKASGAPRPLRLLVDDRYAASATFAPGWQAGTITMGYTGAVAMLGLSTERARSGRPSTRDPVGDTARALRAALTRRGITVASSSPRARTPPGAEQLGAVWSAPVGEVLSLALQDSDNALTEQLARQAAVRAGRPATFAAAAAWVPARVAALGVSTAGVHLVDTSGLSPGTRIPPRVLADVVQLAAGGQQPALRDVLSRLPVAALSGTLYDRFLEPDAAAATGVARAKTGSLPGVSSLAGTLVDRDGRLLVFAIVADNVRPPGSAGGRPGSKGVSDNAWVATHQAREGLDQVVASLAQCGCR